MLTRRIGAASLKKNSARPPRRLSKKALSSAVGAASFASVDRATPRSRSITNSFSHPFANLFSRAGCFTSEAECEAKERIIFWRRFFLCSETAAFARCPSCAAYRRRCRQSRTRATSFIDGEPSLSRSDAGVPDELVDHLRDDVVSPLKPAPAILAARIIHTPGHPPS